MSDPNGSLAVVGLPDSDRSRLGGDIVFAQVLDSGSRADVDGFVDVSGFESVEAALAAGVELPCHAVDPDLFFAENPTEIERAKLLCLSCPIRALCLDAAIERREPWGVWGGEWFDGGHAIAHKRPRGRPRKDLAA